MDELTTMEVESVGWRINELAVESETVYGQTGKKKKKIYGFEWSNQELVGRGVEPMMAEVELTMREIRDGWRRKPEWFSVSGL